MSRKLLPALVVPVLLFASLAVVAATAWIDLERRFSPEQMHATGLDTLSPDQLALLNRLLREDTQAAVAAATAEVVDDEARHHAAPGESRTRAEESFLGLSEEPIRSRVVGTVAGWAPGTVFTLENGQQWRVLKGEMTLHKPMQAPEVVVAPGLAGRWFLQVDEDLPKARVYRVN
jgi:hypothetical protein